MKTTKHIGHSAESSDVAELRNDEPVKPEFLTDEHLTYLDELRESGVTNMYGATPYLTDEFDMPADQAKETLMYWMKTFSKRHAKG